MRRLSSVVISVIAGSVLTGCEQQTLPVDMEIRPSTADFSLSEAAEDGWTLVLALENTSTTQVVLTDWAFTGDWTAGLSIGDAWYGARLHPMTTRGLALHLSEAPPEGVVEASLSFTATSLIGLGESASFQIPIRLEDLPERPNDGCDADGDGFDALFCGGDDCEDNRPEVFPGAPEVCNGRDDDCDGVADEDLESLVQGYLDADGDGFGDANGAVSSCGPVPGLVQNADDCDDTDARAFPGAPERCDGLDQDCDGLVDEDALDAEVWHLDADSDGFGDANRPLLACAPPVGHVADAADCDDAAPGVFPGAPERCNGVDDDCDGEFDASAGAPPLDATPWPVDADADGFGSLTASTLACVRPSGHADTATDCDDTLANVFPGAAEACNSRDDDCDGVIDEDAVDATRFYADADADGFGAAAAPIVACLRPSGAVDNDQDCDDTRGNVFPGAPERCDNVDEDCDGVIDEDPVAGPQWFVDADGDGFGNAGSSLIACLRPAGHVADNRDCDDAQPNVFPGALERCNGIDDDCDFSVDELGAVDGELWYLDRDGDFFGTNEDIVRACERVSGYRDNNLDCDDRNFRVNPSVNELCNGIDDNCNGTIDEAGPASLFWYVDADGDGWGIAEGQVQQCQAPPGFAAFAGDCDDDDPTFHPTAPEFCDDLDHDCDGLVNEVESVDAPFWFLDADDDGFGNALESQRNCFPVAFLVADNTDCNDDNANIFPDAPEQCNGEDDDCDDQIDEDAADAPEWFADADRDRFGDPLDAVRDCEPLPGRVVNAEDCDDSDPLIRPGAVEVCDGLDNDCNGTVDDSGLDSDGDGEDNCVDDTVYTQVFDDVSGGVDALVSLGWRVTDFAELTCCGGAPLPPPRPTPPGPGNAANWQIEADGTLLEVSNAAHSAASSPDLGALPRFTLRADVGSAGINNDAAGLFFAFRAADDFWLVRWDNPYGSYPRYGGTGSMDLIRCLPIACFTLESTNGGLDPSLPGVLDAFAVTVADGVILVTVNGELVLGHNTGRADPIGPYSVGAYAFDTDAGVIYDNFEVVQP